MAKKKFSMAAALGVATGNTFGPFSEIHELSEFIEGHPIWTHQFASETFAEKLSNRIIAIHPFLPNKELIGKVDAHNYAIKLDFYVKRYGTHLEFDNEAK
jgi:hypothetical protein